MKFTKIALTTVFLSLCPQILLAQPTGLSRDEAGRQIKTALANHPVTLHFDLELPPFYDPQLSARLLKLITGPDLGPNESLNKAQYLMASGACGNGE